MKRLTSALIPFLFLALTAHNVRMHPADWPQGYAQADQISATSTIASAKACGASCGRLCPTASF
jgi:hypothetical protein